MEDNEQQVNSGCIRTLQILGTSVCQRGHQSKPLNEESLTVNKLYTDQGPELPPNPQTVLLN
jgi:hypothetical protein